MAQENNYRTVNPATAKVLQTFPHASDAEILNSLSVAEKCYEHDWRWRSITERAQIMSRAANLLKDNLEEHAQRIVTEMGKLINQARREILVSAEILQYYADNTETFLRSHKIPSQNAVVVTEPIGIILAIEPWNFPYCQLARVAGPQIMAGNVVVVKPAPSTPQCALAFARVFEEAGMPPGVYTNLLCSIDQVNTVIDDFRVRGVTLTGSERAGVAVAERAGRHLKKVVLELGGSDAAVILEDANLEQALNACVVGRLMGMGQNCAASKRFIIVGKDRTDAFIEGLVARLPKLTVGEPTNSATTLGPMGSQRSLELILEQISTAAAHGARVVMGGKRIDREGYYMEPTVIVGISPDNPLFNEETFGPVFSVHTAQDEAEAVKLANVTKFGLGASVYSEDKARAQRVAKQLDCGMVFINTHAWLTPEMPWGGVKNSGFGRELGGELGSLEFVNRKLIR